MVSVMWYMMSVGINERKISTLSNSLYFGVGWRRGAGRRRGLEVWTPSTVEAVHTIHHANPLSYFLGDGVAVVNKN
jgi:hypothetical protein